MIVKIWPIKADYNGQKGKVGGMEGLKNSVEYIMDQEKVTTKKEDIMDYIPYEEADMLESSEINTDVDFDRVVNYMSNKDKTENKYISTYLCSNEEPVKDFITSKKNLILKSPPNVISDTGAVAYHIVQSFPRDLDISDEEVHQCGIELVEKLKKYQAIVCSHVHSVTDENQEVHGVCKHNHILINAYIHPDFYDPKRGGQAKYNDCINTYRQLQIYNDEIAIEHGLPIIRDPDTQRVYSWLENDAKNKNSSWKESIRIDIEMCRRVSKDWDEFVRLMARQGYSLKDKKHITYTSPDGHVARGDTLGSQYTKQSLEMYWSIRDNAYKSLKEDLKMNDEPVLSDFVYHYPDTLSIKIPLGPQFMENRQFAYIPLNKNTKGTEESFRTYMEINKLYDICDSTGQVITAASGIEIIRSIEDLRDEERMRYREEVRMKEEEIREERRRREEEKEEQKQRYSNDNFRNSRTGKLYFCGVYDENGRRRTAIELIFVLALIIMKKEDYLWEARERPLMEEENEAFFANTNWKLQNSYDAMVLAKEEQIETPVQLLKRLDIVGADLSRTRKAFNNTSRAVEKMQSLNQAIQTYKRMNKIIEGINALPEGKEKEDLLAKYANEIEEYKIAKHVMHEHHVESDKDIIDFDIRYDKICRDAAELESRLNEYKEEYRRLKKIEYSLQLAQDPKYVYGPSYSAPEKTQTKQYPSLWDKEAQARELANENNIPKEQDKNQEK